MDTSSSDSKANVSETPFLTETNTSVLGQGSSPVPLSRNDMVKIRQKRYMKGNTIDPDLITFFSQLGVLGLHNIYIRPGMGVMIYFEFSESLPAVTEVALAVKLWLDDAKPSLSPKDAKDLENEIRVELVQYSRARRDFHLG